MFFIYSYDIAGNCKAIFRINPDRIESIRPGTGSLFELAFIDTDTPLRFAARDLIGPDGSLENAAAFCRVWGLAEGIMPDTTPNASGKPKSEREPAFRGYVLQGMRGELFGYIQ